MGGLAHFIEDEGVPTTQISLVREHTLAMRPPRALWVPFELGRPLGAPGDAAFQHRVLGAALALLERTDGPAILEDFAEEAPVAAAGDEEGEDWVCPVSLPAPPADLAAGGGFKAAIEDEVRMLNPWYDMAVSARGRTTVGISGLAVEDAVGLIARFLDGEVPDNPRGDVKLSETLKLAVDDVKAFYREAAAAQPGRNTGNEVNDWFYGETAAGRALFALKPRLAALAEETGDGFYKTFGSLLLIPRSQAHRAPAR